MAKARLPTTVQFAVTTVGGAPNAVGTAPRVTTQRAATPNNALRTKLLCILVFSPFFIVIPPSLFEFDLSLLRQLLFLRRAIVLWMPGRVNCERIFIPIPLTGV
jgi:hypothetical protein